MYLDDGNTACINAAMKKWNELAKARMKELKITQETLAEKVGVTQGAVAHWVSGRREPDLETINRILEALGLPRMQVGSQYANVAPAAQPYKDAKEYPLISWIAAGAWQESCDNFAPGDAEEWIDSNAEAGPCGYWLEVRGQSMVATGETVSFPPRMRILVRPEGFDLVSGKFYIARLGDTGETTFKQYVRDAGTEYLQPLNPSYKTMEMGEGVQIIGRVVDAKLPKALF